MNGKNFRDLRLAISCGGTGGHFYPGLSIAKILKKEGGSALLLLSGIHAQKQKKIAEECGIDAVALPEMPSPRRLKNVLKFFDGLFTGYLLAKRALKEHDIDIVLGMGSFTSLPPVFAAKKLKKRIYLHDGNARIGMANRFLSRYAEHIWTAFEAVNADKVKCPCSVIGMPIRPELAMGKVYSKAEAIAELNSRFNAALDEKMITILVFGGSQGAQTINLILPQYLTELPENSCQVIHLTGPGKLEETEKAYAGCKIKHFILEASSDMQLMYGAADFTVSRSGGSTVAELAFFGKAALLVPYPFAAENHQYDNARILEKHGGAIIADNRECSKEKFAEIIGALLNEPQKFAEMGEKSRTAHTHDAVYEILNILNGGFQEML